MILNQVVGGNGIDVIGTKVTNQVASGTILKGDFLKKTVHPSQDTVTNMQQLPKIQYTTYMLSAVMVSDDVGFVAIHPDNVRNLVSIRPFRDNGDSYDFGVDTAVSWGVDSRLQDTCFKAGTNIGGVFCNRDNSNKSVLTLFKVTEDLKVEQFYTNSINLDNGGSQYSLGSLICEDSSYSYILVYTSGSSIGLKISKSNFSVSTFMEKSNEPHLLYGQFGFNFTRYFSGQFCNGYYHHEGWNNFYLGTISTSGVVTRGNEVVVGQYNGGGLSWVQYPVIVVGDLMLLFYNSGSDNSGRDRKTSLCTYRIAGATTVTQVKSPQLIQNRSGGYYQCGQKGVSIGYITKTKVLVCIMGDTYVYDVDQESGNVTMTYVGGGVYTSTGATPDNDDKCLIWSGLGTCYELNRSALMENKFSFPTPGYDEYSKYTEGSEIAGISLSNYPNELDSIDLIIPSV